MNNLDLKITAPGGADSSPYVMPYVGDWTNVCFLDEWLPGFAGVCKASPESSLFGSNYKDVYAFIVLILVLVFRPQGLLGERVGDRA